MPQLCIDQLCGDADATSGLAYAPLKAVAHAQLTADLLYVDSAALVGEARIPGDHEKPVEFRKAGDDVLGKAVSEIFLIGVT